MARGGEERGTWGHDGEGVDPGSVFGLVLGLDGLDGLERLER